MQKNILLTCRALGKSFGETEVFHDVNFTVHAGEKIGLVGPNGSGKTTLLQILSHIISPNTGEVLYSPSTRVGYLPQITSAVKLQEDLLRKNKSKLHKLSAKLHISPELPFRNINELSGGERAKLALLRILLSEEGLILLDEPTNDLDEQGLLILEEWIANSRQGFIIVSHDRAFLDRTATNILALDVHTKTTKLYKGNWSTYWKLHQQEKEKLSARYRDGESLKNHTKHTVQEKLLWADRTKQQRKNIKNLPVHEREKPRAADLRDKEGKMARRSKILRERLEKRLNLTATEKPKESLPLKINFSSNERSGALVFRLNKVTVTRGEKKIGPFSLDLFYGERLLITGANGSGKTTLLKMLQEEIPLTGGEITRGVRVRVGYLPQERTLTEGTSVRTYALTETDKDEPSLRKILHRFQLTEENMEKDISTLSPGESSRLLLALLMANEPNCLILDEPTNNLDSEVAEELEKALRDFPGTLIAVSHDRRFIEHMEFTRILHIDQKKSQTL